MATGPQHLAARTVLTPENEHAVLTPASEQRFTFGADNARDADAFRRGRRRCYIPRWWLKHKYRQFYKVRSSYAIFRLKKQQKNLLTLVSF